jgi:hypothetical protein
MCGGAAAANACGANEASSPIRTTKADLFMQPPETNP